MSRKRNGMLDFMKFLFALVVVLLHSRNIANTGEKTLFGAGYLGVEFFFIVSGLFMAASTLKLGRENLGKDTFNFMKRKICGLMPNVYVAWIIAFVIEHTGEFQIKTVLKDFARSVWELCMVTETGLKGYKANAVSWYLSAMLLAMLLIYPIMKKYKDTFFYIMAPVGFLFIMGITCYEFGKLGGPHAWFGLGYKAMARAVMGVLFGCICFKAGYALSKQRLTRSGRIVISFIEISLYFFSILYMYISDGSKYDWFIVVFLGIAVALSYSQTGIMADYMTHKCFFWLGTYSFSLYLGHGFWSHKMNYYFPNMSYYQRLPIFLVITFVTALVIMYVSVFLRKLWKDRGDMIKKIFVEE